MAICSGNALRAIHLTWVSQRRIHSDSIVWFRTREVAIHLGFTLTEARDILIILERLDCSKEDFERLLSELWQNSTNYGVYRSRYDLSMPPPFDQTEVSKKDRGFVELRDGTRITLFEEWYFRCDAIDAMPFLQAAVSTREKRAQFRESGWSWAEAEASWRAQSSNRTLRQKSLSEWILLQEIV